MRLLKKSRPLSIAHYQDKNFVADLAELSKNYAGRPTPLYYARRSASMSVFKVYLKREDLLHGGAHKVNKLPRTGASCKIYGQDTAHCRNRAQVSTALRRQ